MAKVAPARGGDKTLASRALREAEGVKRAGGRPADFDRNRAVQTLRTRLSKRLPPDVAADIANEAYCRAATTYDAQKGAFSSFLTGVAKNVERECLRRKARDSGQTPRVFPSANALRGLLGFVRSVRRTPGVAAWWLADRLPGALDLEAPPELEASILARLNRWAPPEAGRTASEDWERFALKAALCELGLSQAEIDNVLAPYRAKDKRDRDTLALFFERPGRRVSTKRDRAKRPRPKGQKAESKAVPNKEHDPLVRCIPVTPEEQARVAEARSRRTAEVRARREAANQVESKAPESQR